MVAKAAQSLALQQFSGSVAQAILVVPGESPANRKLALVGDFSTKRSLN